MNTNNVIEHALCCKASISSPSWIGVIAAGLSLPLFCLFKRPMIGVLNKLFIIDQDASFREFGRSIGTGLVLLAVYALVFFLLHRSKGRAGSWAGRLSPWPSWIPLITTDTSTRRCRPRSMISRPSRAVSRLRSPFTGTSSIPRSSRRRWETTSDSSAFSAKAFIPSPAWATASGMFSTGTSTGPTRADIST